MTREICLSEAAYEQFVKNRVFGIPFDSEFSDLQGWINQSKTYFDIRIVGLNYLLCRCLERIMNQGHTCTTVPDLIYQLEQEMAFQIEEFDRHYVEFLMTQAMPDSSFSLAEDLVRLFEKRYE